MPTAKIFKHLLICMNLYQHVKNHLIPSVHISDTINFRVQTPAWPQPFFIHAQPKIFNQFLIFVNLYHHAKNEAVSSVCPGEIVELKILQSAIPIFRTFPPIFGAKKVFSKNCSPVMQNFIRVSSTMLKFRKI